MAQYLAQYAVNTEDKSKLAVIALCKSILNSSAAAQVNKYESNPEMVAVGIAKRAAIGVKEGGQCGLSGFSSSSLISKYIIFAKHPIAANATDEQAITPTIWGNALKVLLRPIDSRLIEYEFK